MKTPKQIHDQHARIQRKIDERARLQSVKADPGTEGSFCLVHIWGNAEARAVWDKACRRASRARSAYERLETSFMDYWHAVDREMLAIYAIDTGDAGIEPDQLAGAQDDGWSPKEFVLWFGEKYGLTKRPGAA
ncbi:MAG: hypothetical protein ACREJM_05840 [Candidatus Saccharimonadales bacterium]